MTSSSESNPGDATQSISTGGPSSGASAVPPGQTGPVHPGPPPGWGPAAGPPGAPGDHGARPGPPPQGPPPGPPTGQLYHGQSPIWGPAGYPPQPPNFLARVGLPNVLAASSIFFGVVTYFMGTVNWLVIPETADRQLENWALQQGDRFGVPAFLSYEMALNPGWFFLLLGTVAVASGITLAPRWRHLLPFLAIGATAGWLGLFAGAMVLPPFIELGVGAILALIFGFVQVALLIAATVLSGRAES